MKDTPSGMLFQQAEAEMLQEVFDWLQSQGNLQSILDENNISNVFPDFKKKFLAGHSAGNFSSQINFGLCVELIVLELNVIFEY